MIDVGINENVILNKVGRSEKKALELYFKECGDGEVIENNPFAQLQRDEIVDTGGDTKLLLFPFKVPDKAEYTPEKKRELIGMDITDFKNQVISILLFYMTSDKLPAISANMFSGTNIKSSEDYNEMILDQNVLDKIFDNICKDFIDAVQPYVGDPKLKFRLKLQRQSKEKHFPTLPKKFLKDQPFMEPMDVPKEQSKLKFSNWEKSNGLDQAGALDKEAADKPEEAAPADPSSIFGKR